jgi:hypothetical protein
MDQRSFCSFTAGLLAGSASLLNAETPAGSRTPALRFTQERTGIGPYHRQSGDRRPHILLISADMVSPDLYRPDRPFAKKCGFPPSVRS